MGYKTYNLLWILSFIWILQLSTWASDEGMRIATDIRITGKSIEGKCLPFAKDLYGRLCRAGGEAHLIVFDWKILNGSRGCHAIVVFMDKEGRYWGMDNLQMRPRLLNGKTAREWAASFVPGYRVTAVKANFWKTEFLGRYACRHQDVRVSRLDIPDRLLAVN